MDRVDLNGAHDAPLPQGPDPAEHPLAYRAIGCLRAGGIRTVGELAARSAPELLALPHFGSDSLRRTEEFLAGLGFSLSEARPRPTTRGADGRRIDPGVEETLRAAGLWDERMPGRCAPGTRLRDLLGAPGISGAEELDRLLSGLAERRLLPKPRGTNELLALLAASRAAREALGEAEKRLRRAWLSHALGKNETDASLDAVGALLDAAKREIGRGALHEGALLDWPPLAAANARLTPEERTLPGLLLALLRMPGFGPTAGEARRAQEAILLHETLDDELRKLLAEVLAPGGRKRIVMLGCFSWGRRLKLRELGERFGVSRERVRQIKLGVARALANAHARRPLPRLRTAARVAEDLYREDGRRHEPGEPRGNEHERRVHAELERRGIARSEEATRHALAALGAISYARALEDDKPKRGS